MEKLIIPHHTDWILWIIVGAAAFLLAARLYNPLRFKAFSILPFHAQRAELENSFRLVVGRGLFDISLGLVSFVVLSLTVFLLLHPFEGAMPFLGEWRLFLRLVIVLLFFYVFKNFMGLLVGWIFNQTEPIARAQNVSFAYRSWLAMILLPLCMALVFLPQAYQVLYYLLFTVLISGYAFSLQFLVIRIWQMNAFSYYKIFYLCALEITPLIFLIAWLVSLYR